MVIAFHANCVAIEDMDDYWLIAFADEKYATRHYLMLSRSYKDDEQDVQHGMNTYHVERDDQLWSCYGGIERFDLHPDRLSVRFTRAGIEQLKADGIEISFGVDLHQFKKLKQRLESIFSGTECLLVRA